jgi:hypothetical protein
MIMATAHSTLKARSGRNPPLKTGTKPKSATRSNPGAKRRKTQPAQASGPHAKDPAAPGKSGSFLVAERGTRIRVRGRLQDMILVELGNLGRVESVLRCLALSMEYETMGIESPYYPDVVDVAGDLVKRSLADLNVLYDGYLPNPLMAGRKIER